MTSLRVLTLLLFAFLLVSLMLTLASGTLEAATWKETVLHTFLGGNDGSYPVAGLIFDSAGNLYGTTNSGGGSGEGVVFKLTSNPGGGWMESVIYHFTGGTDGGFPNGSLIMDSQGNLYGTTAWGGDLACNSPWGCGVVFELAPFGGVWKEKVLYRFSGGTDGSFPSDGLISDAAGNLYGTTWDGGSAGYGEVYELVPNLGSWTKYVIYSFTGGTDGSNPVAAPIIDSAGNLYGTAEYSGDLSCNNGKGCGVVFELTPVVGGGWTETVLYSFADKTDGGYPSTRLLLDSTGNLYGTTPTSSGCPHGCGVVFELVLIPGGGWKEIVLHAFTGPTDGRLPISGLSFDSAGNLYGTTYEGGNLSCGVAGCGMVYKLSPISGRWRETVLREFTQRKDGGWPAAGVIPDSAGNIYGTTSSSYPGGGVVFELSSR